MNGLPHNAKVDRLGITDTLEEAKQAASEVFDEWLAKAGLMIIPGPITPASV
jgi:predicted RNase H-like HicB family nuclease